MGLTTGTRLGPYEIVSSIGAGGMGEVFRARDAELGRHVAIKILRTDVTRDPERLARFAREAQILASLNHPNIAAIYGVVESAGTKALVLELVEGPTLADRLATGSIPVAETLAIAQQIADALDAAHAQGVVHRDLKPANIKLRPDGTVKILDFGLAKALAPDGGSATDDPTSSPTVTAASIPGLILGTAAYMAPEQASGRPVDKRADIWALGVVLYEMVTGRRMFAGETISHVLAAVLTTSPDLTAVPPRLRGLLVRCLEKDPKKRLRDVGDAMSLVLEPAGSIETPSERRRTSWLPWAVVALLLVAAGVLAVPYFQPAPSFQATQFQIAAPPDTAFNVRPGLYAEVSPDGRYIAFLAQGGTAKQPQLYIRGIDELEPRAVADAMVTSRLMWSPDSRFVAFASRGRLQTIEVAGGTPQPLWSIEKRTGVSGSWGPDAILVGTASDPGLFRIAPDTGAVTEVTIANTAGMRPVPLGFLPDGTHFLLGLYSESPGSSAVYVASRESADRVQVVKTDQKAVFVPPNRLFFVKGKSLLVQNMNMRTFALEGEPVRVLESVMTRPPTHLAGFSVSENGVLAFARGPAEDVAELTWYDRAGKVLNTVGKAPYRGIDLSPTGSRVAAHHHPEGRSGGDLWVIDLERQNAATRLTFDESEDSQSPIWSPTGDSIAFSAIRNKRYGIYRKAANGVGSEELLFESETPKVPAGWAPDGKSILFVDYDPKTSGDLWILPLTPAAKPRPFLQAPGDQTHAQISPDGKWVAYTDSGISVQSFPVPGTKYRLSEEGSLPRWRRDGREIFFSGRTAGRIMSVSLTPNGPGLVPGTPQPLFVRRFYSEDHAPTNFNTFAVSADGQRILAPRQPDVDPAIPFVAVVVNWESWIKK
jgi:Tol biopolymer transport system component